MRHQSRQWRTKNEYVNMWKSSRKSTDKISTKSLWKGWALCLYYLHYSNLNSIRENWPIRKQSSLRGDIAKCTLQLFATRSKATLKCRYSRTLYLYSGLRPSVRGALGKITFDNGNLRNLRYTKNICHMILASITSESAHPITQVEPLNPHF